jgi:16S rRNA (cytidine1402-2'-O)-methyltransferase
MFGTLYVVATPIGNLEDITLRALRVLREVGLIAAEDTRRTAKLLAAHGIATSTTSFHVHNARTRLPGLLNQLRLGKDIALVTDAGTPGVSDPGVEFVRACLDAGLPVDVIPGATAPVAAATISGFSLNQLLVFGFVPRKSKEKQAFLHTVSTTPWTLCFFEAPHRILLTLKEMAAILGNRQICVAREITKLHQEFLRGSSEEVLAALRHPKGEFTVVVGPPVATIAEAAPVTDADVTAEFGLLTEQPGPGTRRQRVSEVARKLGRPTREIYATLERAKLRS